MKGLSLFAGGGIGEMGLADSFIDIVVANELLPTRAKLHNFWHRDTEMVQGDISKEETKNEILEKCEDFDIDFVLCTPPCQGVSLIGKNKTVDDYLLDERNYLLFDAIEIIRKLEPSFILIENVPRYLNLYLPLNGKLKSVEEILEYNFGDKYKIETNIYNSIDFGVAQSRERAFIKIYKKNRQWEEPQINKNKILTLRDVIGDLPSLESGEVSHIKNHYARHHDKNHILWMKHTPTGKSAHDNINYYPINRKTGKRIKAYASTYKRLDWDKPSPTITMRNDAISSQANVHPGRLLHDGTYSDARVLTLRELFILTGIEPDIDTPKNVSDSQIRYVIGEAVPPIMIKKIVEGIVLNESS